MSGSQVATLDGTWSYTYDLAGQLTGAVFASTNPDIESQDLTYVYDAAGNRTQTIVNGLTENYTTNNLNQYQSAGTTTYNYDLDGNLVGIDGESEFSASFTYDENGNVISQTNALNQTTSFTYLPNSDKLSGFKDARDNDVLYSYDNRGNLTSIIYEDGTTDKYVYNADGLLTKSINRRSQEITYEYNNNYQVTKETHSDGKIIEYGYDATNTLVTHISDSSSGDVTRFNFDQTENKFIIEYSRVHLRNFLHGYVFDELGRKTQITIQDGTNTYTTNYSYDSLG